MSSERLNDADDSIDFELVYAQMTEVLLPYWFKQESMPAWQAIRKLISERDVFREVLEQIGHDPEHLSDDPDWPLRLIANTTPGDA